MQSSSLFFLPGLPTEALCEGKPLAGIAPRWLIAHIPAGPEISQALDKQKVDLKRKKKKPWGCC